MKNKLMILVVLCFIVYCVLAFSSCVEKPLRIDTSINSNTDTSTEIESNTDVESSTNSDTSTDKVSLEELPLNERAEKVMDNISARNDEEKSMDVKLDVTFEGILSDGREFTFEANGVSSYRYLENDEYQYLQTQSISTIVPGEISDVSTHTIGYMDGKMFQTSVDSSFVTRVYSELTKDEFLEHMDEIYGVSDLELTEDDYDVISCEKIKNKWVIEFSIYSKRGIDIIQREVISDIESLVAETHTISEISFTVIADSEFFMTGYEIEAWFDVVDEKYKDIPKPSLEFSAKVEDIFLPKPLDEIDFDKYTEVDDLRTFDVVNMLLNKKIQSEYCELSSEIKTKILINSYYYTTQKKTETKYVGSFKNTESGIEYSLVYSKSDPTMEYSDITIEYKDLTQVTNDGINSETKVYKTDHAAKKLIDSVIDPIGITLDGLDSAMLYDEDEGIYKFEYVNAGQKLGYNSEFFGASINYDVATLYVVVLDDELISLSYELIVEANNGISLTVNVECTYSE